MHPGAPPGAQRHDRGTGWCRKRIVLALTLIVALAHVARIGTRLHGTARTLSSSFFSDLVIPFAIYFLLCVVERPTLTWPHRALLVFGVASLAEVAQAFGVPLLGRTFDPLDILMFAMGVALAVVLDRVVLHRLPCWQSVAPD